MNMNNSNHNNINTIHDTNNSNMHLMNDLFSPSSFKSVYNYNQPLPQFDFHNILNHTNQSPESNNPPSLTINDNSYLKPSPIPIIPSTDFNSFLTSTFDITDLQEVKQTITSLPIFTDQKPSIGPFSYLAQLIELSYKFNPNLHSKMLDQYQRLYSTIYKYRRIKGDGNCFYRSVIFAYIEQVVLSSNLQLLQNIIVDIKQCYDNDIITKRLYINTTTQIKPELLLKIMILIYVAMKKSQIETAYEILNKSMNNCIHFDYGLILYFRYRLYRYIKANENKFYKKDFGIQIGNLLPSQFETNNGIFLFEAFYNDYLLKMNQDTEKIVIYITPFVLCCKVNVLMFDCDYENNHNEFDYVDRRVNGNGNGSTYENDYGILLISNKEHYEIGYCKNYFTTNKNLFKAYKAEIVYQNKVMTEINNEKEEMNDIDLEIFNDNGNSNNDKVISNININNTQSSAFDFLPVKVENNDNNGKSNHTNTNQHIQCNQSSSSLSQSTVKCLKCNKPVNSIIQSFNICFQCFNTELSSQITTAYIKCLQSFKSFFKTNKNASEYIRMFGAMFNTTKVLINKRPIVIDQAIQMHNQSTPNKIYLNTYLTNIKTSHCLNCHNHINDPVSKVNLPCMCVMCSGKCLNDYFSILNRIEYRRQKDYCCHCGTIYEAYQLIALSVLLCQFQMHQAKSDILIFIKNMIKGKCSKCQCQLNMSDAQEKVIVNCSNTRNELINTLGIDNFNHALCKKCFSYCNQTKMYFCIYCKCDHAIIKQMSNSSEEGFI